MAYSSKVKLIQGIEPFQKPAENLKECQKKFEEYCEENGLVTEVQKVVSAHNPLYYDYLLDYVGYEDVAGKKEERTRTTYMKAAGRFLMLQQVAYAIERDRKSLVRVVMPPPQFIPSANGRAAAICTCEVRIEAMLPMSNEWVVLYSGTGTARRESTGYTSDFYVEKAETAARARAIAAAGIGIDIHGGLSTFEDISEALAGEQNVMPSDEKVKVQLLESKLRACKDMKELEAMVPEIKKEAPHLSANQNAYLADVFEQVIAKLTSQNTNVDKVGK